MRLAVRLILFALLSGPILASEESRAEAWKFPELQPAERFGNIIIDRASTRNKVKAVSFSHWVHRRHFSCRVCHFDLGFDMATGTTEITEAGNRSGKFCGKCHNGLKAFALADNCDRCHNANIDYSRQKYGVLSSLPRTGYANLIDWVRAEEDKMITPAPGSRQKIEFDREITLNADWNFVAPASFSHRKHVAWMDCSNCHPGLFNVKKKGTRDFSMESMLKGEFCGACHITVAFPLNDCKRCHAGMTMW